MNIAIVDYGMGNIKSITGALKYVGVTNILVSSDPALLAKADKLILPGVGAFGKAIEQIREKNLDSLLKELVYGNKKPILGICLGMQLMGKSSDENGLNDGLGFVDAVVRKMEYGVKIPHVGFNQVLLNKSAKLYSGFNTDNVDFYFTHSYSMRSNEDINQGICEYKEKFVASFELDHIAGVQFHPELSQYNGLRVYKNFVTLF